MPPGAIEEKKRGRKGLFGRRDATSVDRGLLSKKPQKQKSVSMLEVPIEIPTAASIAHMKIEENHRPISRPRPTFDRAQTEKNLCSSRGSRAISPATRKRVEMMLGLKAPSILSAPTALEGNDDDVSIAHSAPLHHNRRPKLAKDSSKRLSMELGPRMGPRPDFPKHRSMMNVTTGASKRRDEFWGKKKTLANAKDCGTVATSLVATSKKSDELKAAVKIPDGEVTFVITDIQGSTRMWEEDPQAMKIALDMHDAIIRRCYTKQGGYEITTEGDSFHLAFHHPVDAFTFCLDCQMKLNDAPWSDNILALRSARDDEMRAIRGLRVRMGVHHGACEKEIHPTTQRIFYKGRPLSVAQALEHASHGGQIITTVETWRVISGMAERYLGNPQILDLGKHEMEMKDGGSNLTYQLLQLVPRQLAFDYCAFRCPREQVPQNRYPCGRTFPVPRTLCQLSSAFLDAPYKDQKVTMVFVKIVQIRKISQEEFATESTKLSKLIRRLLIRTNPPGYECQEDNGSWMLAFHTTGSAILFGLNFIRKVNLADSPLRAKVGVHTDKFATMGPHTITGRADYFGPVVNRAARIASNSDIEEVRLGITRDQIKVFDAPKIRDVDVKYIGTEIFKGVGVEMCLFSCKPSIERSDDPRKRFSRRLSLIHDFSESCE